MIFLVAIVTSCMETRVKCNLIPRVSLLPTKKKRDPGNKVELSAGLIMENIQCCTKYLMHFFVVFLTAPQDLHQVLLTLIQGGVECPDPVVMFYFVGNFVSNNSIPMDDAAKLATLNKAHRTLI